MQIQCTQDLNIFQFTKKNRNVRVGHVERLVQSLKEHGFRPSCPIIVNSQMEVIDGQHRLEAARKAGGPVYFVIDDEMTAADWNKMRASWQTSDYLSHFSGTPAYDFLFDLSLETEIPASVLIGICTIGTDIRATRSKFNNGQLEISESNMRFAQIVARRITDFKKYTPYWNRSVFAKAICYICARSDYQHSTMLHKLDMQPTRLVICGKRDEYIQLLQEIYNYKCLEHNRVNWFGPDRGRK